MATLTNIQVGSIVSGMIANIPVGISGILTNIVDNQIFFAEQITGNSITTTAIEDAYQPGIINLAAADVLSLMESQGIGTKSVKIGELSITKGMVDGTSITLRIDGLNKIKAIGEKINYFQAWG